MFIFLRTNIVVSLFTISSLSLALANLKSPSLCALKFVHLVSTS